MLQAACQPVLNTGIEAAPDTRKVKVVKPQAGSRKLDNYSIHRMMLRSWSTLLLLAAMSLLAVRGQAQVVRLPSVDPCPQQFPGLLTAHPDSSAELLEPPGAIGPAPPEQPELPRGARNGVFQKAIFTYGWLASNGDAGLGVNDLETRLVLALPCPKRTTPLVISPGFAVHYLDGAGGVDLPARFYDAYCQFRWMAQATPRLGVDLSVTPGVYSDFEQGTSEAFRLTGHGAGAWQWTPTTKLILGAAYLDRDDIKVMPIAGLVWEPNNDLKFDLTFPHPRIAQRLYWSGAYTEDIQDWIYVLGELGGGTWAYRRTDGIDSQVTYRDYRVAIGIERENLTGLNASLEIGYIFGRRLEFLDGTPDFKPTDTVMVRTSLTY